jgi:hypothetical protein
MISKGYELDVIGIIFAQTTLEFKDIFMRRGVFYGKTPSIFSLGMPIHIHFRLRGNP